MTFWSFGSGVRLNPSVAAALNRTAERAFPWLLLAGGCYIVFGSWARHLPSDTSTVFPFFMVSPAHFPLVGLISISMGSLLLGLRPFVGSLPKGFTRPLGQMVIATLINWVLALGLAWCGLRVGASLNAGDPTRVLWDGRTLGIAVVLLAAQGIGLPLYAWWRWSGDRDMNKITDMFAKAIREATAESEALRQRPVQHEKVNGDRDAGSS